MGSTEKAVVVFSGGPDSTAAALWAASEGYEVELLTFQFRNESQYGELSAAMQVARTLGRRHTIFDFKSPMAHFGSEVQVLMHSGTATLEQAGDRGSHEKDRIATKGYRLRFGAGLILAAAANYALCHGTSILIWGATKDDASGGALDYSQDFCGKFAALIGTAVGAAFQIIVPFSSSHKYELFADHFRGREALFAETWSCKSGGIVQCGQCHPCKARRVAARIARVSDSSHYQEMNIEWPFSEDEMADPQRISRADLARIMPSEKPPELL
jgi:7-cyano-7-deazaguanine synthase